MKALGVGSTGNRTQLMGNMVLLRSLMHEWTRREDGDGEVATRAESHIPNTYCTSATS
jgi:hypothetical protein